MKFCDTCHSSYPNEFQTCPKDQTVLRTTSELLQGMIIRDKYQIMERIGAGGMAVVYKARHLAFNELRAIKVVNSRLLDDESFVRRFKSEAIITRKLQHPNAVRVDDLDSTEDGRPFMVMEFVHGNDLRHIIQRAGALPVKRALAITRQVAAALGAAHAIGITHRDIKPDNILITDPGDGGDLVKVLDFGIAKVREANLEAAHSATKTGMVVGTPQYISPEQAMGRHGDQIDGRADLYSLGVVLYEMVTGRLPFESDTPMGMLLHHIQSIAPRAHEISPGQRIPEALSLMLVRALEKDRALRFQSANEFAVALEDVEQEISTGVTNIRTRPAMAAAAPAPARARTPQFSPAPAPARAAAPQQRYVRPPESPRSRNWLIYVGALVLIGGLVGSIYWVKMGQAQPTDATPANNTSLMMPDDRIVAEVRAALAGSAEIKSNIDISSRDGVVTLTGRVSGLYEQQMADGLAKGVSGVKSVKNLTEYEKVSPVVGDAGTGTQTGGDLGVGSGRGGATSRSQRTQAAAPRGPSAADKQRAQELVAQGESHRVNGDYDSAISSFRQALDKDPENAAARAGISKAEKAKAAEEEIMRRR
jgi:serine/threonine-protein kinase